METAVLVTPEAVARETIDAALIAAGWAVLDVATTNLFAGRLRQTIHCKVYAGQLVPQDSADEPASTLLVRLREKRESATVGRPSKRSSGKKDQYAFW